MNGQTRDLVTRPYIELVDDILTALVGGVVNERIRFDPRQPAFPLSRVAQTVRGITGTTAGQRQTFLPERDFRLAGIGEAVVWVEGGSHPDDDTFFYVDYTVPDGTPPLTDINIGSVVRTICEAVGREIATLYEAVNLAYRSGFLDTAEGSALDLVVAILGITRHGAGTAEGLVSFIRDPNVDGDITIPAGLELTDSTGAKRFSTLAQRTLQRGQQRVDVPVRALVGGDQGQAAAGEISELTRPLAGIERVANLEPTSQAPAPETDEELRVRARQALRGLGRATIAALDLAIREAGGTPVAFLDPVTRPETQPGLVTAVVTAEPERLPGVRDAVHNTRAAGVAAAVVGRYVYVTLRLRGTYPAGTPADGVNAIRAGVLAAMDAYVTDLTAGTPLDGPALRQAVEQVPGLGNPEAVEVIAAPQDLTVPADARQVDPSLVTSTERPGQPPTDAELAAWQFTVSAHVAGEPWWIALQTGAEDVALVTAGGGG